MAQSFHNLSHLTWNFMRDQGDWFGPRFLTEADNVVLQNWNSLGSMTYCIGSLGFNPQERVVEKLNPGLIKIRSKFPTCLFINLEIFI